MPACALVGQHALDGGRGRRPRGGVREAKPQRAAVRRQLLDVEDVQAVPGEQRAVASSDR